MRFSRHVLLLVVFCLSVTLSVAGVRHERSRQQHPEETRALWVVRYSLTSPEAIRNIVREAKSHGFNTLFVQVRGRGDAWYSSDLEPRAEALSGQPVSYDPLKLIIEAAHSNGIKVNAWMNTYLSWTGKNHPRSARHIINAHPEWIARDNSNAYTTIATDHCEGAFLQPSNPAVQDHIFKVFTDVARRYDVDGIHFDYVRYPGKNYDMSDSTLKRFQKYISPELTPVGIAAVKADKTRLAYIHNFPERWEQWRRVQVTDLVKRISREVHSIKPDLEVSAAVFAEANDARADKGQDWREWLSQGYLEAICPMAYSKNTDTVFRQIAEAVAAANGRKVYAGLGAWRLTAQDTAVKIEKARAAGANGVNLFSWDGITNEGKNMAFLDYISRNCFAPQTVQKADLPGTELPE